MSILAKFPAGVSKLSVHGLHQWDYGRKLVIEAPDLPALIEVHFACPGMSEAVVRACAAANGAAEVTIPDRCLEQTSPITAWVYEIGETSGHTIKTIVLHIIARTRPAPSADVPQDFYDKYTDLITAVNEQVRSLMAGDVKVASSEIADRAGFATQAHFADNAETATHAYTADSATHADSADSAVVSRLDNPTVWTLPTEPDPDTGNFVPAFALEDPGLYAAVVSVNGVEVTDIISVENTSHDAAGARVRFSSSSGLLYFPYGDEQYNTIVAVRQLAKY